MPPSLAEYVMLHLDGSIGSHPDVQPGSILLPETPAPPGGNVLKKKKKQTMKAVT